MLLTKWPELHKRAMGVAILLGVRWRNVLWILAPHRQLELARVGQTTYAYPARLVRCKIAHQRPQSHARENPRQAKVAVGYFLHPIGAAEEVTVEAGVVCKLIIAGPSSRVRCAPPTLTLPRGTASAAAAAAVSMVARTIPRQASIAYVR